MKEIKVENISNSITAEGIDVSSYSGDVVSVISWPRSGNHWMRFLLGTYIHKKTDWDNISSIAPMVYHINENDIKELPIPKIVGYHESHRVHFDTSKTIYLYRDPRDVIVSKYYYDRKMGNNGNALLEDYVNKFCYGSISAFGGWEEHVKSWVDCADVNMSYENMLKDTESSLELVLGAIEIDISIGKIEETVKWCSFDNMRKLEDAQGWVWDDRAEKDIKFMRKGKSRQWEDELTERQVKKVESRFGDLMQRLGYV